MSAGDAAGRDHAHHDETFPRLEVSELVAGSEAERVQRERWQPWVLGAGLTALALGLPNAAVWGARGLVTDAAQGSPHPALLLAPALRALAEALGLPLERAAYLVSALAYGACLPTLAGTLRRIGFEPRVALVAAATALASPLAWIGATLPGSFSAGLLGAALLLRAAFAGKAGTVSAIWLAASALHPENALLWPAVLLVERRVGRGRGALGILAAAGALAVLVALHVWLGVWADASWPRPEARRLAIGPLLALAGLAWAWLGPMALAGARRAPEESPPPVWLGLGCFTTLPAALAMGVLERPLGAWLVVAAAVGLADVWGRGLPERAARSLALLALQVATTALAATWLVRADPHREWRALARASLEPRDVVLTADPTHAYFLCRRWGVEAIEVPAGDGAPPEAAVEDALGRAARSGGRAVLDGLGWPPGEASGGGGGGRLWRLQGTGLELCP